MKKNFFHLLVVTVLLAFCACVSADSTPTTAPAVTETQAVEETFSPETTPPTERPAVEVARELIKEGEYAVAMDALEPAVGTEADLLRLRCSLGNPQVGDQIVLGHFEQDANTENGVEPIVWVVLATEENKVFLLSLCCLDTQPYHDVLDGRTTWADSTLRVWLNEDFCNAAFSDTEQMLLVDSELLNPNCPKYNTPGGEKTIDKVFLLSLDDVHTYLPNELKTAHVTEYAAGRGCFRNASKNGWWWLRSPGVYSRDAAYIDANGKLFEYGYIIHRQGWAVRPALWINLDV